MAYKHCNYSKSSIFLVLGGSMCEHTKRSKFANPTHIQYSSLHRKVNISHNGTKQPKGFYNEPSNEG